MMAPHSADIVTHLSAVARGGERNGVPDLCCQSAVAFLARHPYDRHAQYLHDHVRTQLVWMTLQTALGRDHLGAAAEKHGVCVPDKRRGSPAQ